MNQAEQLHNLNMKCRDDALFAGKVWSPNYFTNKFATFQYDMLDRIKNRPKDVDIIVIECMRGAAKTLLLSSLLSVHDGVYEGLKFTVIASNADDMAQRIVGDSINIIKSDRFSSMFPKAKIIKDRKMLIEVYDDSEVGGFEFQIMSRGRTSQATGLRFKENRINRFIGDDLEHPEAAYSQELVDANERYVNEVVRPAMAPGGLIILIGTPFAFDCTTQRFSRYQRGVMTLRYPILVDNRIGGVYRGTERIGREMSDILGIDEGRSIWEDRFPTEKVLQDRDNAAINSTSAFGSWMRQFMLDPRPPGAVQFNMDNIKYINPNDITVKLNVFVLCDFAYSRQSWADDSAIVAVGLDDDGNYYVLHADKDKWGDIGTTDKVFDVAQKFKDNLKLVGVEVRSFGFVQKRMIEKKRDTGMNFGLTELKPGNRSKSERIKALIPLIDDGRFHMVRGLRKLEDEMYRFKGEELKHGDDLMDALAYILDVAYRPETVRTKEQLAKEENHRIWSAIIKEEEDKIKEHSNIENVWRVNESYNDIERYY